LITSFVSRNIAQAGKNWTLKSSVLLLILQLAITLVWWSRSINILKFQNVSMT